MTEMEWLNLSWRSNEDPFVYLRYDEIRDRLRSPHVGIYRGFKIAHEGRLMMVIDPAKLVNQLVHQMRTWETQNHHSGTPTVAKINKLGREIEGLANTFDLSIQQGGFYN